MSDQQGNRGGSRIGSCACASERGVALLRGIVETLFLELCVVDRQGTIRLVNAAWREFARANDGDPGCTGEGANYFEVCQRVSGSEAEGASRFAEGLRDVLEGRRDTYEQEYACPMPAQECWYLAHVGALEVLGERYAVIAHHCITERKLAQQSQALALERLRRVVDTVPDILYEMDLEGRLQDWNRAFEVVTGYSYEELKGRSVLELCEAESRPVIAAAIARKIRGEDTAVEGWLRTKDGQLRLYQWIGRPLRDARGQVRGATGVGRDITAQRQAEESLKRSEAMLAEAQRIAHLGSWEWERGADCMRWSDELYRIAGQDPERFTPTWDHFLELVCSEDRERTRRAIGLAWQTHQPIEVEFRLLRPDGEVRVVLARGRAVLGRHGQPERLLGTIQDLSEMKALDQRIRLQYEELKELDRLKGAFVNSVTHELRTPLTSIMGFAEFLEDEVGGPLTPQQRQFVQELQRGARRLSNLLNDLLDFARLEAGTFKLTIREGDLNAKIRESLESLKPQAHEARVELIANLSEDPLVIVADHERLGQVLINLIGNAIKFTPPGGRVTVRSCRVPEGVRCEIHDTGIGIAPTDIPKLFRRFTQLEPGIRSGSGAGLGLSISKSIVDAHGGWIGVESEPDKGSTFWFVIPLQPR